MDTKPASTRRELRRGACTRSGLALLALWSALAIPVGALARSSGSVPPEVQSQLDEMRALIQQQNSVIGELKEQLQRQSVLKSPGREPEAATAAKRTGPEAPSTAVAEEAGPPAEASAVAREAKPAPAEGTPKAVTAGAAQDGITKVADAAVPAPDARLYDNMHRSDQYGLKSLWDSLHPQDHKSKPWYEKMSLRGYSQIRFDRSIQWDREEADPWMFSDRFINGNAENFGIRRARLIFSSDVSDHLFVYIQPEFAGSTSPSSNSTYFAQLRDLYGDVYIDKTKVHRFRVGLSKVPYGWENMQSSQNRVPLDRAVSINTGVSPNERDLGVFYYFTPVAKQKLLKELVDGGLKGSELGRGTRPEQPADRGRGTLPLGRLRDAILQVRHRPLRHHHALRSLPVLQGRLPLAGQRALRHQHRVGHGRRVADPARTGVDRRVRDRRRHQRGHRQQGGPDLLPRLERPDLPSPGAAELLRALGFGV